MTRQLWPGELIQLLNKLNITQMIITNPDIGEQSHNKICSFGSLGEELLVTFKWCVWSRLSNPQDQRFDFDPGRFHVSAISFEVDQRDDDRVIVWIEQKRQRLTFLPQGHPAQLIVPF